MHIDFAPLQGYLDCVYWQVSYRPLCSWRCCNSLDGSSVISDDRYGCGYRHEFPDGWNQITLDSVQIVQTIRCSLPHSLVPVLPYILDGDS